MSTYAIGDVHGDFLLLDALLGRLEAELSPGDTVVFLGDVIDRGARSKDCVERILELGRKGPCAVVSIMGNHEEWLLETLEDPTRHSWLLSMEGLATVGSYSGEAEALLRRAMRETGPELIIERLPLPYGSFFETMPDTHKAWFRSLASLHRGDGAVFVHAAVPPDREILEGDAHASRWGFPGFPERYSGAELVVYGHESGLARLVDGRVMPRVENRTICLDTVAHGVLSAIALPEGRLIQVGRRRGRT